MRNSRREPRGKDRVDRAWETYYEHSVFMVYFPQDFRNYLGMVIAGNEWVHEPNALDLMAWGIALTYQARMEPFRFDAALSRYYESNGRDGGGKFRRQYAEEGTPRRQWSFRLQLTMQIALENISRRANIEDRINRYPTQAQLLFDTLYYVSMLHELDKPLNHRFEITPPILRSYLRRRAENDRNPRFRDDFPDKEHANELFARLFQYLRLLSDPSAVKEELLKFFVDQKPLDDPERRRWKKISDALMPDHLPIVHVDKPIEWNDKNPPNRIEFRFLIDRVGSGLAEEEDPFEVARKAIGGVKAWKEMLVALFGSAANGQQIAANARILDSTPTWEAVARARRLLAEPSASITPEVSEALSQNISDHEMRFAAVQIRAFLEMVQAWREAFAMGLECGSKAALAVPLGDAESRRMNGLEALNAFCQLDLFDDDPERVSDFLSRQLAWPPEVHDALPDAANAMARSSSFAEAPEGLEPYCNSLRMLAPISEVPPIEWPTLWRTFWSQWDIQASGVRLRSENQAVANGISVLHTARHGGIPVIPRVRRTLSIGEWWRLAALAELGDEKVPSDVAKAAAEALEGSPEFSDAFTAFRARSRTPVTILFVEVTSTRSPAWSWSPDRRVLAVMPPPADVLKADEDAVKSIRSVNDAFERLRQSTIMRDRSFTARLLLGGLLRVQRLIRASLRWIFTRVRLEDVPDLIYRAARLWPIGIRVRRLDFVRCIEIGPDFTPPTSEPRDTHVYFGFGPVPRGVAPRYIPSPASVVDLMRRIEAHGRRSPNAFRLPFGLEWRGAPTGR